MRRIVSVLLLAVIAAVIALGCSRQPPPHVGEWQAKSFRDTKTFIADGIIHFLEDGNVQITYGGFPPLVSEGKYKFDYSKDPVQLDIDWTGDNTLLRIHGIVRFVGDKKEQMQILFSTKSRPSKFRPTRIWRPATKTAPAISRARKPTRIGSSKSY